MIGQELKIIFESDKAFLTKDRPLTFEQISLSSFIKLFREPAYCIVNVIKYLETDKRIHCEIKSYNIGVTQFDITQNNLFKELELIQKVTFRTIDTMKMLAIAKGRIGSSLTGITNSNLNKKQPINQIINETFSIPFKDVQFKNLGISFEYILRKYNRKVIFTISNPDIREEFDAIKEYFSNVLKTKKIHVEAEIEIDNNIWTPISVKSPEIDKINKQLIEEVKLEIIKQTTRKNKETTESTFTLDEYFDTFTDQKIKSKVFYENDIEFFEDLITISNTKHYKHLRYLSSIHSHKIMKLRFIHKPLSFLFLIERESYFHYIWETLDTNEATYIWHIEKDKRLLKDMLTNVDQIINEMNSEGKTQYIIKKEDSFKRIFHDYTKPNDGFEKWKDELNNILT
jgi:hypothetical protein